MWQQSGRYCQYYKIFSHLQTYRPQYKMLQVMEKHCTTQYQISRRVGSYLSGLVGEPCEPELEDALAVGGGRGDHGGRQG